MKKALLPFILILLFSCDNMQKKTDPETDKRESSSHVYSDSLTHDLQMLRTSDHINGFSVGIVDKDEILYLNGFGLADISMQKPYSPTTIQNIASISKTQIGIALMKAQEQGKLNLDDDINVHLPFDVVNPHHPLHPITIRQLATHTSTILDTDHYDDRSYILNTGEDPEIYNLESTGVDFKPYDTKIPMEEFLEKLLSRKGEWYHPDNYLKSAPGAVVEYSNVGATLAAYIVSLSTGVDFSAYTMKHILEPLEMTSSGWSFESIEMDRHTVLYSSINNPLPRYFLITYPDGGLLTCAEDLSKFLRELIQAKSGEGTLLSKESYAEIFTGQLTIDGDSNQNNDDDEKDEDQSGIFMDLESDGLIGHSGGDPGVVTYMYFDPDKEIGHILLMNTSISSKEGYDQYISIQRTIMKYQNKFVL